MIDRSKAQRLVGEALMVAGALFFITLGIILEAKE
jgi:hypothetical protein